MRIYSALQLLLSASSFKLFNAVLAADRNFTVTNNCPFTIWYNQINTAGSGTAPDQPTGWVAPPKSSVSFGVAGDWQYGFIWARRDCKFDKKENSVNSCLDGGCPGGQLHCYALPHAPVTLAEFSLSTDADLPDEYAVVLVDGFNLPMIINNNAGCGVAQCSHDLAHNCPAPLKGPYNSKGFPIGCNSACQAGIAPDPNNDPNCCTGIYNTSATCTPTGVEFYSYFKSNCPDTAVYAFDTKNSSFTCHSAFQADYTITFCPKITT
ncbi:thaumatin-like protein [Lactarius quietus]|nr:thaumatin-like protein [Lactarius quietus]